MPAPPRRCTSSPAPGRRRTGTARSARASARAAAALARGSVPSPILPRPGMPALPGRRRRSRHHSRAAITRGAGRAQDPDQRRVGRRAQRGEPRDQEPRDARSRWAALRTAAPRTSTRAVAAARAAQHAWWKVPGVEKAKLLREIGARIRAREHALATLMTQETGKPLLRGHRLHRLGGGLLRVLRRGGALELRQLDAAGRAAPAQLHHQGAVRRGRGDRAVQLPAAADGLEGRAGDRGGQHGRLQAAAPEPALEPACWPRSTTSCRPASSTCHRRRRDRHRAGRASRRRPDRLHRLDRGGPQDRRGGRRRSSRRSTSSSARSTRSSSSRTPTSTSRCPASPGRGCSTPARSAPRASASTSSGRSRPSSPSGCTSTSRVLEVGDPMKPDTDLGPLISPRPRAASRTRSRARSRTARSLRLGGRAFRPCRAARALLPADDPDRRAPRQRADARGDLRTGARRSRPSPTPTRRSGSRTTPSTASAPRSTPRTSRPRCGRWSRSRPAPSGSTTR